MDIPAHVLALGGLIGIYERELTLVLWAVLIGSGIVAVWAWLFLPTADKVAKKPVLLTWQDLEGRFKDLRAREIEAAQARRSSSALAAAQVLDVSGRHVWWVRGSTDALRDDVKRLCQLAGSALKASGFDSSPRLKRERDDLDRWLWFLVEIGRIEKNMTTTSFEYQNRVERHTYNTRTLINDSLAGCVECLRRESSPVTP